ncbi:MAG: c-type cytochrome [Rhodospirillales bacterium]|nr:c-type cytochrome [Rhodospirillales bacterium]
MLLLAAGAPAGKQIVLHGNDNGAMPCAACHGINGQGNAAIGAPALAGMPAPSIVSTLNTLAARPSATAPMPSIAAALTPRERRDVAAYFSSLPKPAS